MRKVVIKVCVPCKKCKGKAVEHLKKVEGAKEVTPTDCKIIVIGDFTLDDILKTLDKFKDKFSLISIEELPPPPPPPKATEPSKPAEEEKKKEEPPKEDKGKDKEKEKTKIVVIREPEPVCETPEPIYEPPPYQPPTIIISDSLPTTSSYPSYESDNCYTSVDNPPKRGSDMDLAILIGLVLLVIVLLASMRSSSSSGSMTEAAGALFWGFMESTVSTLGTLFLIILALLALMGILCLCDPRPPQPCKC